MSPARSYEAAMRPLSEDVQRVNLKAPGIVPAPNKRFPLASASG